MANILREAAYWAGTDGVSFLCSYWEPDAGPWQEMGGEPGQQRVAFHAGDIRTHVYRIEQVRVSANATANRKPDYWVIRETIPRAEAIARYGDRVIKDRRDPGYDSGRLSQDRGLERTGYLLPSLDELHRDQDTVDKITVFCERSEYLASGLSMVIVGDALVYLGVLLYGVVPILRFADGASDPAFYPQPIMEGWIDHQMRVNAVLSKWV